jgi:hypothetical protein
MKHQKKGKKKDEVHQVKGNLQATMAKKVMESGSDIQATVEDVNVTDAGKHGHAEVVDKK